MPLFSEELKGKSEETRCRLYTQFQRAVKAGELPALKLLDKFSLTGSKGQARQVHEYAYPQSAAKQVTKWLEQQEGPANPQAVTAKDVQDMTDEQLTVLIKAQRKPAKQAPRKPAKRPQKQKVTVNLTEIDLARSAPDNTPTND